MKNENQVLKANNMTIIYRQAHNGDSRILLCQTLPSTSKTFLRNIFGEGIKKSLRKEKKSQ